MVANDFARYPSLQGRAVLVTGGASGIGAEIVRQFARQGACVAFIDILDDEGEALAASIAAEGGRAWFRHADLTDLPAVRDAIGRLRDASGPFRVLVNNAANDERHTIEAMTVAEWDRCIDVNLKHGFFIAQALLPDLKAAGDGAIVNLGSAAVRVGAGGMPAYVTSKAAIEGLTRALARDLGPAGIRVNCIVPGWTITPRQRNRWLTPEAERALLERQCLKRLLLPEDVARVVLFYASADASGCTAQSHVVDCGWT